ncbi:TonB family protein [Lysobacter sp. LF1]|uniref:Protein TonB n=1 Tax=Lysobacter stagni TaxID=3045172 RepID=A0ABT6XEB8_9GAMM|nr:TonB family protein [Lysobacter sp. LF1]MDI9238478.1 TonB family protein [Lysobacter sp. LF1]
MGLLMLMLVLAVTGCDSPPDASRSVAGDAPQAPALPAPVFGDLDADGLRVRAERALHEQRIHAPAADCAVDYYLALRQRAGEGHGVGAALAELQPYVVIAAEQALAREDLEETRRLLALLVRMDATAPAVPRLREGLRVAQQAADRAEGARIVELAKPTPPMPSPAPRPVSMASAPQPQPTAPVANPPPAPTKVASAEATASPVAPVAPLESSSPAPQALPRLLADSPPRYPLGAQKRRIEGSVLVTFTIQPDGSVSDARSLSAQPAGVFEDAALAAAARWRFEATGRRVTTTRTLAFRLPPDSKG